jgi:plasmid maintenance system antidote protein VapI
MIGIDNHSQEGHDPRAMSPHNPDSPRMVWMRARMKAIGVRPSDVADALGVSRPRVADILKGRRKVQEDEVAALARCLKMTTGLLCAHLAANRAASKGAETMDPEAFRALEQVMDQLTALKTDQLHAVRELIGRLYPEAAALTPDAPPPKK